VLGFAQMRGIEGASQNEVGYRLGDRDSSKGVYHIASV